METKLYRKRLIPAENVLLKSDELMYRSEDYLITRWKTIHPRKDMDHGVSCYCLRRGWKLSRFYDAENRFLYWYCDIIEHNYDPESDTYVFTDLLADVLIYPDGRVKVVDLAELRSAYENHLITLNQLLDALSKLDALLNLVYSEQFPEESEELHAAMEAICAK